MQFSKETLAILKNFASINGGIILRKGNKINTKNVVGSIYAAANITDDIEYDVAIYDLNGLLNILSLTGEDSEISLVEQDTMIQIRSNKSEVYIPVAQDSTIVSPKKYVDFPAASLVFELSSEEYQDIMKVSRAVFVDTLIIENVDGEIVINGYNKLADAKYSRKLYTHKIGKYSEDADFRFILKVQNIKLIPDDYKVSLYGKGTNMAINFTGSAIDYIISVEKESSNTFE